MQQPPTVLLFDIDGTLLRAGGAGRRALDRAFDTLWNRPDACDHIQFGGMTDPLIAHEAFAFIQEPDTPENHARLFSTYLGYLEEEIARSQTYQILPGAPEILAKVSGIPNVAIGLGTGNLEQGARVKLARANLNHWFSFGGFGSDHHDRGEMIKIGAQRGASSLNTTLEQCRVVIIGDTPRDVAAAQYIGAECFAVTTGSWEREALESAGATRTFDTLTHPELPQLLLRGV